MGGSRRPHPRPSQPTRTRRWTSTAPGSIRPCPGRPWPARWGCGACRGKKSIRAVEQDRPDVKQMRDTWRPGQPALDPARLVFVDEAWNRTDMAPTHGRGPKGRRLVAAVPHGHGKTTTFVAALRADGMTAPTVIDGAVTGDLFVAYLEPQSVPTLRRGDVVVMDNLACHKRAGVRVAIKKAGAELPYLPPYRPDLNPIERAFGKLKSLPRSVGKRSIDGLWDFLGKALDAFAPDECRRYFRHDGYGPKPTLQGI
nr:IS630 family transposase [Limnoglobus roseus]